MPLWMYEAGRMLRTATLHAVNAGLIMFAAAVLIQDAAALAGM